MPSKAGREDVGSPGKTSSASPKENTRFSPCHIYGRFRYSPKTGQRVISGLPDQDCAIPWKLAAELTRYVEQSATSTNQTLSRGISLTTSRSEHKKAFCRATAFRILKSVFSG